MFMCLANSINAVRRGLLLAVIALTITVAPGAPVHAQSNCETRASLIAKLDKGFGEQPVAIGLASTGYVIEVLTSANGTWTILITHPNGMSCVAAAGEHWQTLKTVKQPGETS